MPVPPYTPPPEDGSADHAILRTKPGEEVCDFCSDPDVKWRYPCYSHVGLVTDLPGLQLLDQSVGDWAACDTCHDLIERSDRDALAKRTIDGMLEMMRALPAFTAIRSEVETQVRTIQDRFWSNRDGAPVPFVKGASR